MTKLSARDKLARARFQLARDQPFFAYLVFQLEFKEDPAVPTGTMGVSNDGELHYVPEYVDKLSDDNLKAVLTHEVLHLCFEHTNPQRIGARDWVLSNVAQDYVINLLIKSNNVGELPAGCLYNEAFAGMCWEEVYDLLLKSVKKVKVGVLSPDMGKGGCYKPGHKHGKGGKEREGGGKAPIDWVEKMHEAEANARMQGKVPLGIDRLIEDIHHRPLDWRALIQSKFQARVKINYSYRRPSRRSTDDIIFPSPTREGVDLVVAIDTSGSISQEDLSAFYSEVKSMQESIPGTRLTVLTCDADVHEAVSAESWDELKELIHFKGGGGTDFRPPFKYIEEKQLTPDMVVYLTDGEGTFPEKDSGIETVWVSCQGLFKVPFGTCVKFNADK